MVGVNPIIIKINYLIKLVLELDEPLATVICVMEILWIAGWGSTFSFKLDENNHLV